MRPDQPDGDAAWIINHPLVNRLFDEMEDILMERAIHAKPDDDAARRLAMSEVRVIRDLRQRLKAMSRGKNFSGKSTGLPSESKFLP